MNNEIPIIESEPGKNGYWKIYPDYKIWHDESNMSFKTPDEITKKYPMGGNWLTLKEGDNKIRLVSDCVDYGNHFNSATQKSVICIGKEHCEFCKKGLKPNVQFLAWVIDRVDGKVKLFRFGYKIYKQIIAYKNNPDYAFEETPEYDITIRRTGTGKQSDYVVVPARQNTLLTEKEQIKITEKIKDLNEIIENMKAKVSQKELNVPEEESEEEDIDTKDIPF